MEKDLSLDPITSRVLMKLIRTQLEEEVHPLKLQISKTR